MSKPKKHHYIPKSFLQNFAEREKEVDWVDVLLNREGSEIKKLSTSNLCHQKNLYKLPADGNNDPYALEKYYGEHVDGMYPEVYTMLTDTNLIKLSDEEKKKILNTVLSLYFRTPGFLNRNVDMIEKAFTRAGEMYTDPSQMISVDWGNGLVKFKREELEFVKEEQKLLLKTSFLIGHLENWQRFVEYKMDCGIAIMTVPDDIPLITCDNPVCIMNPIGQHNPDDIFHVDNIIEIAIDPKTYVTIMPNSAKMLSGGWVQRTSRDKYFAAGTNRTTEQAREEYMIAFPGDLRKHIDSQAALSVDNAENREIGQKAKETTENALELLHLIQTNGSIYHEEVVNKIKELQTSGMKEDETMKGIVEMLRSKGLL